MFQEGNIFKEGLVHFPLLECALENDFPKCGPIHGPQGSIGLRLEWDELAWEAKLSGKYLVKGWGDDEETSNDFDNYFVVKKDPD